MYIVTGAAGFIGSNLVKKLNNEGITDIICVDVLSENNIPNISGLEYIDFVRPEDIFDYSGKNIDTIFHLGATSSTRAKDWNSLYLNNIDYTKKIFNGLRHRNFVFASSASVYGDSTDNKEVASNEAPKNLYAASKLICDKWLETQTSIQYQSWRFFNVYGNREQSKLISKSASPYTSFLQQAIDQKKITLFKNSNSVLRDFVCVEDVVNIMYKKHFDNDSFICNLGTGNPNSFQHWADLISKKTQARLNYIDIPEDIKNGYQMYTKSNNDKLNSLVGNYKFITPEEWIEKNL